MKRIFSFMILAALALVASAQGLVIGIIDMGFDYTHPAFRAEDGSLLISRVWEQGTEGAHPAGYDYGYEMTTTAAILTACADDQTQSHGSHVTARALQYAGREAGTEVVLVSKGSGRVDENRLRDAIEYIFDYAESVAKPCVINMSMGSHRGPHDGTSAFDAFINKTVGAGRILCGSVGNSGISTGHLETSGEPLNTFIIYRSQDNTTGTVDIWGTPGMKYSVQLSAIQYENGNVSSQSEVVVVGPASDDAQSGVKDYTWAPTTGRLKGVFKFHTDIDERNGKTHTTIDIDQSSAAMKYELALNITPLSEGTIHAWSDEITSTFFDHDREGFVKGDNRYGITELGGTADRIISVGAMKDDGTVADYSSRGPRLDGAVKPNVFAYGDNIESALNSYDQYQSLYPYTQTIEQDGRQYHYGTMSGTSMASPMVTGVVGSWLRHNPQLTPEEAMAYMNPNEVINPEAGLANSILAVRANAEKNMYDLSGRRVSTKRNSVSHGVLKHGVYIVDGKKIIF